MNIDLSLREFSSDVASKKTMPGGGSVCAYALSLSNSLASMVANFTVGKKKYEKYEDDIKDVLDKVDKFSDYILAMVDEDCEAFLPLSRAYKLPENTDEEKTLKNKEIQRCLKIAAEVPYKLILACDDVLNLHRELAIKGSKMLISDVAVGVMMLKAAVNGAKINVLININYMDDREYAENIWKDTVSICERVSVDCEKIYEDVVSQLTR